MEREIIAKENMDANVCNRCGADCRIGNHLIQWSKTEYLCHQCIDNDRCDGAHESIHGKDE